MRYGGNAMRRWRVAGAGLTAVAAAFALVGSGAVIAQAPTPERTAVAESPLVPGESGGSALAELRATEATIEARIGSGDLRRETSDTDPIVSGRVHERYGQYYQGIPVFAADTTRQLNAFGQTISVFGVYYGDITIDTTATVTSDQAQALLDVSAGAGAVVRETPTLVVLPVAGGYRLTWTARVGSMQDGLTYRTFIDATTGNVVLSYNDTWTRRAQAPGRGPGIGVVGDPLEVGERPASPGPGFEAVDLSRPGQNTTYDLRGDVTRALTISIGATPVSDADIAQSPDGSWSGAVASAQAYTGLTLDYYRLRFKRAGLDAHNGTVRCFVDLGRPEDAATLGASPPLANFYDNAFYAGNGRVFFGAGSVAAGHATWAAGLDVVSHELTHGVTEFTSNLLYQFEAGALNEAFSDMMSAAVEFTWQPLGDGPAKADWLYGEDLASGSPLRSFADPQSVNAPDHYSLKRITVLDDDNGGVHANASIVDHMYYLAIMGGTDRVSQMAVTGVGFNQRAEIETVIYRAFTEMLPSNATFSAARAATIQAARDLYGLGSAPETAIAEAWAAVGVS